jgi:large subunit ribosomal protein L13
MRLSYLLAGAGPQKLTQVLDFSYNRGLCSAKWFRGRDQNTLPKSVLTRGTPTAEKNPTNLCFERKLMKTFSAKPADVTHEWFVIDATDKVLGRVASEVALRLRGKHKAIYTPHVDTGDFIVIINAAQLRVTGAKPLDKIYCRHSGYPGGITATNFRDMQAKHPGRALEKAVKGMLPKGPLGYAMIKKLKVYAEETHPHAAQQPKALVL